MMPEPVTPMPEREAGSTRKQKIRALFDGLAGEREKWLARNAFFHEDDRNYMRFLIPEGLRGDRFGAFCTPGP